MSACIGDMRNAYKILVQKPEGKRSLHIERIISKYMLKRYRLWGYKWINVSFEIFTMVMFQVEVF